MYKTMHKGGYPHWTIKKHGFWHDNRKDSWDEDTLDVGNLRTMPKGPAGTVSFRKLGENVRMMPEGDDALDLTRMVQYCMQNTKEEWRYPKDYEELLDLLGGPAKVEKENTDGAVFERWEHRKPPPPMERSSQGSELLERWQTGKRSSSRKRSDRDTRSRTVSPGISLLSERRAALNKVREDAEVAAAVEIKDDSRSGDGGKAPYARAPASTARHRTLGQDVDS